MDQDDPRLLGNLYHDLLEQLFATIREEDGVLRSDRLDRYREIVGELLTALVEGRFPASRRLLPPARGAAALRLEGAIGPLLQEELESHSGYRILKEEGWHRATLSEPNVELVGRIDRLLRNSETGTLVLIDYKRKNLPKKRELGVEEPRETLAEMQLPLYALLFEANDGQLERVLYCSIENGAWQRVYDEGGFPGSDPWHGAETWAAALDEVRSRVAETADAIRSGDFRFPEPEQGCETCVFRGICRTKFRVR